MVMSANKLGDQGFMIRDLIPQEPKFFRTGTIRILKECQL
jgi:hypothetical protein